MTVVYSSSSRENPSALGAQGKKKSVYRWSLATMKTLRHESGPGRPSTTIACFPSIKSSSRVILKPSPASAICVLAACSAVRPEASSALICTQASPGTSPGIPFGLIIIRYGGLGVSSVG